MKKRLFSLIFLLIMIVMFSYNVYPDPTGAIITNGTPERGSPDSLNGKPIEADAGNMTAVGINSSKISTRWQGYYGNITGLITLDDASTNTIYSWFITSPRGEIYAVNGSTTPTWANVECLQFNRSVTNTDLTMLQTNLGMSVDDDDTVNKTFNLTFTGSFTIGSSNTIDSEDNCSLVSLYVNDGYDEVNFNETILIENDNNLIIYTALLEQDETGFSGSSLDFEMIVGDNGDIVASTTYWFYVELS